MALSTKPYKGARDFYPEDKRFQKFLFEKWREIVESYGYEEYDAPILEPLEIYLAKTGDEIVKEQTYVFEDRGKRKVVIRPEMTPSVSRLVAGKRQELSYPLRWYSIPNLWRYERPQRGRLREHWQLNVDIFGVQSSDAEIELISLIDDIFKSFGADESMYEIRVNNRALTNYILNDYLKLSKKSQHNVLKLIDRMHKMERNTFITKLDECLTSKEKEKGFAEKLLVILSSKDISKLSEDIKKHSSYKELNDLLKRLKRSGTERVIFDPTLMRGFDYYTGIVFEAYDLDPNNNRSMMGGGRYDGLVGLFGVEPVPTVGFGWGDVTLYNFLQIHHLLPTLSTETDVYVAIDYTGKKIGDQLKSASKKGVDKVMIIGENEVRTQKYKLKTLSSGKEEELSINDVIKALQ